jgi:VWFA-related protein
MRFAMVAALLLPHVVIARGQIPSPDSSILRTQSTLVLVPALVTTRAGDLVYTLSADDFRLTDNTVEQKLTLEQDAGSRPLALAVVVETGGAGARQLDKFRKLGTMIESIAGSVPHLVAVVNFDSKPELFANFTSDDGEIRAAMSRLQAGDGGSATIDALSFAVDLLRKQPPQYRRAILLLGETIDHGSNMKLTDALRAISETNTAIYSLAFSTSRNEMKHEAPKTFGQITIAGVPIGPPAPPGPSAGCMSRKQDDDTDEDLEVSDSRFKQAWDCLSLLAPPLRAAKMSAMLAKNALRQNVPEAVAQITGGEYFRFSSLKDMERDLAAVSNHVPNRYVLSFQPQSPSPGVHAIELRLRDRPDLVVKARTSYWTRGNVAVVQNPLDGR